MFIIEYLKILLFLLCGLGTIVGMFVLVLSFFGSMEIVYKAKILDSPPTPRWERVLNRMTWGMNGLYAVYHILSNREQLFRTVLLMETTEYAPRGPFDDEPPSYGPSTTGYAPIAGTILVFHANQEEEGEPLYVLRPFEFLTEDWRVVSGF
jgi:hypothetical protein